MVLKWVLLCVTQELVLRPSPCGTCNLPHGNRAAATQTCCFSVMHLD